MADDSTALARKETATELRLKEEDAQAAEIIRRVTAKAARVVDALYLEPTDPKYNKDAEKPWPECSTKTRVSVMLVKEDRDRQANAGPRAFGVILLPVRAASAKEWEDEARKTIDVKVTGK